MELPQELAALSAAVTERVRTLVDACPERRDLVHGDLLHGNVLVSPDARRVEAVLSWKCSVRGDFLYDAVLLDTIADAAAAAGVAVTGGIIMATGGWYCLDPSVALIIACHALALLRKVLARLRSAI